MTYTAQFPQNGNNTIKDGEVILIKKKSFFRIEENRYIVYVMKLRILTY